ncbi:MAG: DUF971 domain-containing protein [Phycisphaerales bacterium]|nr:MAG: DUF971 domain-containing protein [Phycisphaerales bacterium]
MDPPAPHPAEHSRRPASDPAVSPASLKVRLKEQKLRVEWKDGQTSEFDFLWLRRRCPCATCVTERQAPKPLLPILKADPSREIRVEGAQPVGHYAIQFTWSDGHNSGIFDFRFLRALHDERSQST